MLEKSAYMIDVHKMRDSKGETFMWIMFCHERTKGFTEWKRVEIAFSPLYVAENECIRVAKLTAQTLGIQFVEKQTERKSHLTLVE